MISNIVIVGGGSAGWLTAGIIAAEFQAQGAAFSVTLIESPDIASIGVGEGTWPTMRSTLKHIGISETEFIRTCHASFKQGSKFIGWNSGTDGEAYYHPFTPPFAYTETDFHQVWKKYFSDKSYCDTATIQGRVCDEFKGPKLITTPEYSCVLNYGYHLDAAKFAKLLQEHCVKHLNVKHVRDKVSQVNTDSEEFIVSLTCENYGELSGDLFIDCSGSQSVILGQHYKIPFINKSQYSNNNCALVAQVQYPSGESPISSVTCATAKTAGWIWDIGLSSRRGLGYVFSDQYIDIDQAESGLRQYIENSAGKRLAEEASVRKIPFTAGHREKFWHKNCVAIGMAAGFIEPLEASALAMVELSAQFVRDEMPLCKASLAIVESRFNQIFQYRWQKIIEFLKLHYCLSQRSDTEYWRDCRKTDSIPDGLAELLTLWRYRAPYFRDLLNAEEVFPSASYQYVLYGMGFKSQLNEKKSSATDRGKMLVQEGLSKFSKYIDLAPDNRALLEEINIHGMKKV